ncbi:hypothetical protein ABZ826_20340 [Streptomyces sp. NPDC047515]|uniref:hypothetical protein n=1 Tax=Streptomyces sp. NPDC047515 TaxID=3155380 RepID=UPI0033F3A46E
MARPREGDSVSRKKGGAKGRKNRARQVYIFTEGEVTEPEYIDIIVKKGTPATPGLAARVATYERITAVLGTPPGSRLSC